MLWLSCYSPWFLRQCCSQTWNSPSMLGDWPMKCLYFFCAEIIRTYDHGFWGLNCGPHAYKAITFWPNCPISPRHVYRTCTFPKPVCLKGTLSWILCDHSPLIKTHALKDRVSSVECTIVFQKHEFNYQIIFSDVGTWKPERF